MKEFANVVHFRGDRGCATKSAENADVSPSAGSFALRRARYFSKTGVPLLNAEQQHTLTNMLDEVDPDTKHHLIIQNLRMVVSIAKRYINRGLELVELVRVGNQGLIHALERFEPEGGFCFSTYVTWSVSRQIELAIMKHGNGLISSQAYPALLDSFDNAASKHTETCVEYPAGCSGRSA